MKELCIKDICKKDSSSLKQKELKESGRYPVYGASGIAGYLDSYQQGESYIGIVKDGSGIGRVAFYPEKTSLIGTMQYILPKEGYDIRYIGYCLQSLDLSKYKQGAAIPHIYFRDYGERKVYVTDDLKEQQRIVSRLDSAFAHIDELKANAEKQLSEARALFQKALTKAMEPKEGWEEKTLGEIADFVRGPFGGSLTKAMFKPSGYAVYEQQHAIHGHTKIRYFIDDRKYKEMERFSVEAGDLIMSCSGVTLGRVNLLPSNTPVGIINQALLKMRVKPIMNVLFFKYWLESTHFQEIIMKYSGGAAIPNVPAVKIIKEINISIPSSAEQQRIVSRLDSLSAHVRELEEVLQKTIAECDALKQALLRKVFE